MIIVVIIYKSSKKFIYNKKMKFIMNFFNQFLMELNFYLDLNLSKVTKILFKRKLMSFMNQNEGKDINDIYGVDLFYSSSEF